MGDAKKYGLQVGFDSRLKLKFCGIKVTSDAGLLAYCELDETLELTQMGTAFWWTHAWAPTSIT